MESHRLIDTILLKDRELKAKFAEDKIYKKDASGKIIKNKYGAQIFTDEYATQLHTSLNGMVEKQMRASIIATANYWYTAWVNAGKPDLSDLDPSELTKRNAKPLEDELQLWKKGKLFGIESEKEF